jgi:hypothetical protein
MTDRENDSKRFWLGRDVSVSLAIPTRTRPHGSGNARRLEAVLSLGIAIGVLTAAEHAAAADPPGRPVPARKLIEFGWDEPDTAFLRRHHAAMEQTPFDGCIFHVMAATPQGEPENFTWLCWGKRSFTPAALEPALADLKATSFRRFTHNFLRFNTAPGDLDWFDDHAAVLNNARLAAGVAREGRCAGILLDVEEYQGKLFTYSRQRDAATRSWDEYATQARRRGREIMDAFQDAFPGLTVFLTFGYSLPRTVSQRNQTSLAACDYGLLAPFLDGLVAAARGNTRLVDGYELSYGYKEPARFDAAYALMKQGVLPITADPEKYARVVSAGFGLWMDFDWRKHGWNTGDPSRNYFTPTGFEASLRRALERSDEFVWIYTETPRWWSPEGTRLELPDAYETAIRHARQAQGTD